MRRSVSILAAALAAGCAVPASAAPRPIDPDPMTVSGRFALPRADATVVRGRLAPKVALSGPLPAMLDWDVETFRVAVDKAAAKSLDNFGYGAGPASASGSALPVTVEIGPVQIDQEDKATVARVRLRLRADPSAGPCLIQEAAGQFRALRPVRSGDGQRVFAVVASIAVIAGEAAAGLVPSGPNTFMSDQFETADLENAALNARRVTGQGEGVSPDRSDKGAARYAAAGAVQLAMAALIDRLGQSDACRPEVMP